MIKNKTKKQNFKNQKIRPDFQAVYLLDAQLSNSVIQNFTFPTILYRLRFCSEDKRYLFQEELSLLPRGLEYAIDQRITIESIGDKLRVTFIDGSAQIASLNQIIQYREEGKIARLDPLMELDIPIFDSPTLTGSESELFTTGYEKNLQISYYLYDHLGNTRILFHTVLDCSDDVEYVAEYVADYYPFGKILREWAPCQIECYLTTDHERDKGAGYDYRGARFYDSDLGRFLSVDPLAVEYAMWSTYTYVANSPLMYTDPNGMEWSESNKQLANHFGTFGGGGDGYSGYSSLFQPDKNGAISLDVLMGNLKSANISSIGEMRDYFRYSTFQRPFYHGKSNGEGEPWVFIYTQGAGWIDIVHFLNGALSGLQLGEATEIFQSATGNMSAWSYEDLQSNLQGALFRLHHGLGGDDFLDDFQNWFEGLRATRPEVAPNWNNVPPNSGATNGYGDNGNGKNRGMTIPQNRGYVPMFAPFYQSLSSKYKIETYNRMMHDRTSTHTH